MAKNPQEFLSEIQNDSADVRYAAWAAAGDMDAQVIPGLAKLLVSEKPGVRKASEEALKKIVHSGKPGVSQQLANLVEKSQPLPVRVIALRQLSLVGGDDVVPKVAVLLTEPAVQEEAVFCLERIPGKASAAALFDSYSMVDEEFKPRILAALGHRRVPEAAELCNRTFSSTSTPLAMAALKAFGRIGTRPASINKFPDFKGLTAWDQVEYQDSILRYADALVQQGNALEAIRLYRQSLVRTMDHVQCAALIGIGKIGTPEAAGLVFAKLNSPSRTVRITAAKVWEQMKDTAAKKA